MSKQVIDLNSNNFTPADQYILVKPNKDKTEKYTKSGIIVPVKKKSALDRQTIGKIVAVSEELKSKGLLHDDISVMWPNTDGIDIEFNDGEFVLLRYKSIFGTSKVTTK
jgi:co-chaperonin GroES (HSP10)